MIYWTNYHSHEYEILGRSKKFDSTIYTFDIETTSYIVYNGEVKAGIYYDQLTTEEKENIYKGACMYIWQFGINDAIYYGRTWQEFEEFLKRLEKVSPYRKFVFVHNLAFEFQFLKSVFHFDEVTARKSHRVMTALMRDYNIMFKCSYFMSNCKLEKLSDVYSLPVEKQTGDLDYNKLRHNDTPLTTEELKYCEYDCLVVYHYIKRELETYENVLKIPTTSTGHVRRELKTLVQKNYRYKSKVRKAINTDPHVYNLLVDSFMGGYTHANYTYASEVLKNVDSYDIASSYPYVLVSCRFPATEFKKCNIKNITQMSTKVAYLLVVRLTHVKCRYFNTFISASKCKNIRAAKYDNGRIIECDQAEIVLTDIDFRFILDAYDCEYEILESYFSIYKFLPIDFINFVLDKYVIKTEYKNVEEKKLEYQIEKAKFNALYGMSVTNTIKDHVLYEDDTGLWHEEELTNQEIIDSLNVEKKKAFLSFAYGVWVTAYARDNLLRRVLELDDYVVYCDTDSCKLVQGYDKNVFIKYNESVEERLKYVSTLLNIDFYRFAPNDIKGNRHVIGIFELETKGDQKYTYDEFITQGAKKYAVKIGGNFEITVAGVPKKAAKILTDLHEFKDDLVFKYEDSGKQIIFYVEDQENIKMIDYLGNERIVTDKSSCTILPNTYKMSRALDYANLISDNSSKRAIYRE